MHYFDYRNGILHAEDVALDTIARTVGTPFYCYSAATIERHYKVFAEAFAPCDTLVCYSIKANSNLSVIRTLAKLGSGADVVSEGEIHRALAAGIPPEKIVFSGVGKTRAEMAFALDAGIFGFNVELEAELRSLSEVAVSRGAVARIAFRINPDVDAKTHAKISTGKAEHKFGISWREAPALYALARTLPGLSVEGVHMHIGSQITSIEPFRDAFELLASLVEELRRDGHTISFVNLGGGLGIPYRWDQEDPPLPADYAEVAVEVAKRLGAKLLFEPGRVIMGNAGLLVTRVIYIKHGAGKRFVIADVGMNDLVRPTLYDAYHDIWPVREALKQGPMTQRRSGGAGLRNWRLHRQGPPAARACRRRPAGDHDIRRLWGRAVFGLQFAPPRAGGAGQRRGLRRCAPAPLIRRHAESGDRRALAALGLDAK